MNTAPMYKNIVSISKKLLTSFEENLNEEFDKDAKILERLNVLAQTLMDESKNARNFDRSKTIIIFKDLTSFFENDNNSTKITQYELCKSKLVHALHSFLSLPLKEEESKSQGKSEEIATSKDSEEYITIMSRYLCMVEVFLENDNSKMLKSLVTLFENAIKISFSNYYHQELMAYHDGVNLAYDLKKYCKRNKLQVVYEPDIERKFIEQEAAEKGEIPQQTLAFKKALKTKLLEKQPNFEGEGFEDEEIMKSLSEPKMEKFISKQEVQTEPLIKNEEIKEDHRSIKSKNEENSIAFLKRDALYKELKCVNVSVENSSTVEVIKDFLRNKINNKDHVKQLKTHSNLGSISNQIQGIFDKARMHISKNTSQSEEPTDVQSMISKMVHDTFNEPDNTDKLNENDKMLLIKDLEVLLSKNPNPLQSKPFEISSSKLTEEEEKKSDPKKEGKKVLKDDPELVQTQANPMVGDLPPISENNPISKTTRDQPRSTSEEEIIDFGVNKKPKWDFFGKIKNMFFKKKPMNESVYGEEEEEEDEDSADQFSEGLAFKHQLLNANESAQKDMNEEDKQIEEGDKGKEEENKFIDAPFELKNIQEDEDVVFDFYYNRTKITCMKTIYELVNYQPTFRSIIDPHIIYFKIRDRKLEKEVTDNSENSDEKEESISSKEETLLRTIKVNSEHLQPTIACFMSKYISPYIQPDVKVKNPYSQNNTNPYSYTQPPVQKSGSKIGIGPEEQRLISKKTVKILEALTYILKYWSEFKYHNVWVDKNRIVPRPDELFKNLLDDYVQKLLLEPLNLVLEHKKYKCEELMGILKGNPYLLSFDTRVFFFKTAAFAYTGEFHRTVHFLVQHLRRKYSGVPDQAIGKQSKDKVKIDRKNILESTVKLFTTPGRIKRKNFLEIEYCNEEGTGLGPTMEFYYLCSKEFRQLDGLWRNTEDNSLFPSPFELSSAKYGSEKVLKYFETMGGIISKAMSDDRLTDLPFSSVFWEICTGESITFNHISKLDSVFGASINELREYSMKRQSIITNKDLDEQIRERQLEACKLKNGATVEDLCLYFVIPGTEIELKTNSKDLQVTDDNLSEYLELLLNSMLLKSCEKQVAAFKKGFGRSTDYLKILKPHEIELIICGNNDDEKEWTIQNMKEHIIPAHGFHETSQTYLDLLNYMSALTKDKRRQFLTFVTGSPRLPLGGFKSLKPKMNIVRKNEGSENPNIYLPSVMTCQNFLKIPEYSTAQILAERFDIASAEGQESFTLS